MEKSISRRHFLRVTGTGLAGAALLGAAGCGQEVGGGGGGQQGSTEYLVEAKDGPYLIGLTNGFLGNSWRTQMVAEIEYAAQQRSDEIKDLIVTNADNDVATQNSLIGNLVSRGVDILLIDAVSASAQNGALRRAYQQGVLVVSYDTLVSSPHAILVNTDQRKFGEIGGKWLAEQMGGKGQIFALNGLSGSVVNEQRWGAAKKVLEDAGIEIVGQANADWDQAKGRAAAADLLTAHPDVTGIYSQGGAMTLGALQELQARGKELIPIPGEGYNGLLKAWQELKQSEGWSSIAPSHPPTISVSALDVALKAIKGEKLDRKQVVDLPIITQGNLGKFVRPDFPDSLWLPTDLPESDLEKLFG